MTFTGLFFNQQARPVKDYSAKLVLRCILPKKWFVFGSHEDTVINTALRGTAVFHEAYLHPR